MSSQGLSSMWVCVLLLLLSRFSRVQLCVTPGTAAHQAPPSLDSPGKNTGVGCHFLLQCMKVKSQSEVTQLCPTPSDPMDCSPPGSSVHGIFQAGVLEWGAIAFSWVCVLTSSYSDVSGSGPTQMALLLKTLYKFTFWSTGD